MKRSFILLSLPALPVLIGGIFAGRHFSFDHLGIVLAVLGAIYLGMSIYFRNKQRPFAMQLMLVGEICFVMGVLLFTWFQQ